MSNAKLTFLQNANVNKFVEFLTRIIRSEREVDHQYLDRGLARRKEPIRNEADRDFEYLQNAFKAYYWPKYENKYEENCALLQTLKFQLEEALDELSEEKMYYAASRVLWWGAGHRNQPLYSRNMAWLNKKIDNGGAVISILDEACKIFESDSFDHEIFDDIRYRSNAGFTKIYALLGNDFIIYDSRVAAGLGLLVAQFCEDQKLQEVPDVLDLGWSKAKYVDKETGEPKDNRNPSTHNFVFSEITGRDQSLHAMSNWRANLLLGEAISRLERLGEIPEWLGHEDHLRKVEAALFMLGKDIPP